MRCQYCGSPRYTEDSADTVCLECATVMVARNNLVADYDYSMQSSVKSTTAKRIRHDDDPEQPNFDGGLTRRQRMLVAMSNEHRQQHHQAAQRDAIFSDVCMALRVDRDHVKALAKEMVDEFYKREKKSSANEKEVSFRGNRKKMLVAASIMFAMRDAPDGALQRNEIVNRMCFDNNDFGQMSDRMRAVLLNEPCNDVFKRCLSREVTIDDVLNRILSDLCPTRLNESQKMKLRKASISLNARLSKDDVASSEYKNFLRAKQVGGIVWKACGLLNYEKLVSVRDVAIVCDVCEATVKTATNVVNDLVVASIRRSKMKDV